MLFPFWFLRAGFGFRLHQFLVIAYLSLSRDVAYIYRLPFSILTLAPEVPTVKHAHIIDLLHVGISFHVYKIACEELESNAK